MKMDTWENNSQYLAQVGHFLGGGSIVILVAIFLGYAWLPYAMLGVLIAAAIKEFVYDAHYELPKQTFGDNLMDFAFYQLGSLVGAGLMMLAHHLHRIA